MSRVPQPQNDRVRTFANREYCAFGLESEVYCLPVDEDEEERQDAFCRILSERIGNTVLVPFPPRGQDEPTVLDCGFGKGSWIDDLLSEHPDCEVTGIDIFLGEDEDNDDDDDDDDTDDGVQEFIKKRWNLNAPFPDDRSPSRLRPESFDLINSKCLADGIHTDRWPAYIGELKRLLTRGGWIQMAEPYLCFQSDNGRLDEAVGLRAWWEWYQTYMNRMGRDARIGRHLHRYLRASGFEQVTQTVYNLPIGDWNSDRSELGPEVRTSVVRLLRSFTYAFLRVAGMSIDVYRNMVRSAEADLRKNELRLYYTIYVVTARRPRR